MAPLLPQEKNTNKAVITSHFHFQSIGNPFIYYVFERKVRKNTGESLGYKAFFFFFWNQQWHWSLEIVGHCICRNSMLSSEERGLLNQEESDAKLSPVFWKSSRLSVVRCTTTFQDIFWNEYQPGLGQKQKKPNRGLYCSVGWTGHFTLQFYPR